MFWSVLALSSYACLFSLFFFFVCDKQEEKAEQRIKQVLSKCQPLDQFGQDRLLVVFGFPTFWVWTNWWELHSHSHYVIHGQENGWMNILRGQTIFHPGQSYWIHTQYFGGWNLLLPRLNSKPSRKFRAQQHWPYVFWILVCSYLDM